jgi:putative heme iron utilization protein
MKDIDISSLEAERDSLLTAAKTVLMAAPGDDGAPPEMGVTPLVWHEGAMFIYPSRLSAHVRAVLAAGSAACLVIEDEASAQNIWARKRIKFDSEIIDIDRNSNIFNEVCDVFATRHGPTMGLIREFTDFHLFQLRPSGGVMVLGFAQAYRLAGSNLAVTAHLRQS